MDLRAREDVRYSPIVPAEWKVRFGQSGATQTEGRLLDLSPRGLSFTARCLNCSKCDLSILHHRITALSITPNDTVLQGPVDHQRCRVVLAPAMSKKLAEWLQHQQSAFIPIPPETDIGKRIIAIVDSLTDRTNCPVLDRASLWRWLQANALSHTEMLDALDAAANALDAKNHLDNARIATDITALIGTLKAAFPDGHHAALDCVSVRMPLIYSANLWPSVFAVPQLAQTGAQYRGNFKQLESWTNDPQCCGRRWLLALDLFINSTRTVNSFFSKVARDTTLCSKYESIFVLAPLSRGQPKLDMSCLPEHLRRPTSEVVRFAREIAPSSEPAPSAPLTTTIARRADPRADATTEKHRAFVTFPLGCPLHNPSILWSETNHWTPLFNPVDYYIPTIRPFPRAPVFAAYPVTLDALLQRLQAGIPTVLHAPRGIGKTFLAARALDLLRVNHYVFWHDCLDLETIDNVLAHLDSFLAQLGLPPFLTEAWLEGTHSETDLARELLERLHALERPVIMVFDAVYRLYRPESPKSHIPATENITRFLQALCAEPHRPLGGLGILFILQTHEHGGPTDPLPYEDDPLQDQVRLSLSLEPSQMLRVPSDPTDVFDTESDLAERLLPRHCLETPDWKRSVRLFSHQDPYKTWLTCFCMQRNPELFQRVFCLDRSRYFADIEVFHSAVEKFLTSSEMTLLCVASTFMRPWTIYDMDIVLAAVSTALPRLRLEGRTWEVLNQLLANRAPFLIRLTGTRDDPQLVNPRLSSDPENQLKDDHFEMPSVSVSYFAAILRNQPETAAVVYRALAALLRDKLERQSCQQAASTWAQGDRPLYLIEHIQYLCRAGTLNDAARTYYLDGNSLGWERSRRQGAAILEAAGARLDPASATPSLQGTHNVHLMPDAECQVRARYARALLELADFERAHRWLAHLPSELWYSNARLTSRCRVSIEQARHAQYSGQPSDASRLYESIRAEISAAPDRCHDDNFMLIQCALAQAQCDMTLGGLDRAVYHLDVAMSDMQRQLTSGGADYALCQEKYDRHRGTIHLLSGRLDDARRAFKGLLKSHGAAVAHYKLACVSLEEARLLEARGLISGCPHVARALCNALDAAKQCVLPASVLENPDRSWLCRLRRGPRQSRWLAQTSQGCPI